MTLDPATAAARADFEGMQVYFCSDACRGRFLVNPTAYRPVVSPLQTGGDQACSIPSGHASLRLDPAALGVAAGTAVLATTLLMSFYFGMLTLVSSWLFTVQQFDDHCHATRSGFAQSRCAHRREWT